MADKFPYKVFNDLAAKLKAAEEETKATKAQLQSLQSINLTEKEKLKLQFTTFSDEVECLSREKEKLWQQNRTLSAQVKDLNSKLSKLTNENNRYHLRLAMSNYFDLSATTSPRPAFKTDSATCPPSPSIAMIVA